MLNVLVDSLDDVPEGAREHYQERDGKFQLDLTGAYSTIDRDKLLESLRKEREVTSGHAGTIKTFGDWTPEKIRSLETSNDQVVIELTALKKDGGPTGEDIEKLVEGRVSARLAPVQRDLDRANVSIESLTGERDTLAQSQTKGKILREVVGAFGVKELGANPDARVDVELWAANAFEVDETTGKVVSLDANGIVPGLSAGEVFKDMKDTNQRRHWFGATVGAGASGSGDKADTGDNPFIIDDKGKIANFTAASAMTQTDPARAKRLATAAKAQRFFPALFRAA